MTDDKGGVGPIGWMLQKEKNLLPCQVLNHSSSAVQPAP